MDTQGMVPQKNTGPDVTVPVELQQHQAIASYSCNIVMTVAAFPLNALLQKHKASFAQLPNMQQPP